MYEKRVLLEINVAIVSYVTIDNGNRTEWSPIRFVIIKVINKITSMITD